MVVECNKCGTRFQLDAARIPENGIRVRCSRCKNAFYLQHPSQSQANAVEAVVEEAVAHEVMAPPGSTQELPIARPSDSSGVGQASAVPADFDVPDDEEEDDWQFNEELPEFDDDAPAEDTPNSSSVKDRVADEFDAVSLEIGADDLLPSNMTLGTPGSTGDASCETEMDSESGLAGVRAEAFGSLDDLSEQTEAADPPPIASREDVSENPEDWDFFGDSEANVSGTATAGSHAMPISAPGPATSRVAASAAQVLVPGDWKGLEGDRSVSGIAGVASALAWVACFGLLAAGIFFGVAGSVDRSVSAPASIELGEMRATHIRGSFLETALAGTLYLVTGDLVNSGDVRRALHRSVQVSLLGKDGRDLNLPPAAAGRDVDSDRFRQMPLDELQKSQGRASRSLAIQQMGPGESVPFTAVFLSLPEPASQFRIRALPFDGTANRISLNSVNTPQDGSE